MSNSIKPTILENVDNEISDLCTIKTQVSQFRAQMGTKLTYEQYCILVLSTTQAYDAQYEINANLRGTIHSVYNSEINNHNPTEYDLDDSYNIDSSIL